MKNNNIASFAIGILAGFIVGIVFTLTAVRSSAKYSQGYGLYCANTVLNNPSIAIDTIRTIRNQDTTTTYEFYKKAQK